MSRPAAKKELGQHFLVDQNLLGVIGRLSELGPEDVVLEVGPGLGVLTTYLADRAARVHAVELDRSLEPRLRETLASRENVELHFGDALRLDLGALEPLPGKLVSNLPYNIGTPLIVESLVGLPSVGAEDQERKQITERRRLEHDRVLARLDRGGIFREHCLVDRR